MILSIVKTSLTALRRDRAALALSFVLPVAFFSIFATIFGGQKDGMSKIKVILVDEDRSRASENLARGLKNENELWVVTAPTSRNKNAAPQPDYTAASAEAAVKAGDVPIALIIPKGFGAHPVSFGPEQAGNQQVKIQILNDPSDMIAEQMVSGLLQKVAMTSMPSDMAEMGLKYSSQYLGGLTPAQQKIMNGNVQRLRQMEAEKGSQGDGAAGSSAGSGFGGIIPVDSRAVAGTGKQHDMISFYAAAIGVMFLLFTASNAAGAILDEAESGALDRVLSSHVTMTQLIAGKLAYNTLHAFTQLTVMFLWAWAVFKVDLFSHVPGFLIMGISTAFAVAAFGLLLASACKTRGQLGALSTLLILIMSSIGGSMFPRYFMPESMQKAGLFTINAWAIDGFTKVFWRNQPILDLWPQVAVLLAVGAALFLIARRVARRWEFA